MWSARRGKRDKKRRKREPESSDKANHDALQGEVHTEPIPTPPEIGAFLTIGYNSTIRCLESMSRNVTPDIFRVSAAPPDANVGIKAAQSLSAVFVARSDQPDILYAQLPVSIFTASLARPANTPVRLITLPHGAGERISASLHIPRVSIIGILELAPNAKSLLGLIEQRVAPVDIEWLAKGGSGKYVPVNIIEKKVASYAKSENSQNQTKSLRPPKTKAGSKGRQGWTAGG